MKKGIALAAAWSLALPASAIIPNLPLPSFPGIGKVGVISGGNFSMNGTGFAISPTWILTASHVGGDKFEQNGQVYQVIQTVNHPTADVALLRVVGPLQSALPLKLDFFPGGVPAGQTALAGGASRIQGYGWTGTYTSTGYTTQTGTQGTLRGARNALDLFMPNVTVEVSPGNFKTTDYIFYDLDDPAGSGPNLLGVGALGSDEGGMHVFDSGCPWTVFENNRERAVGVGGIVGTFSGSGVARPWDWGGFGAAALLQTYSPFVTANVSDLGRAILNPPTFTLGALTSGTVNDLYLTDNLGIATSTLMSTVSSREALIMHMTGTTTASPANSLQLVFKARTNTRFAICAIDLRNVATNSYVNVGSFVLTKNDFMTTMPIANPNAYVSALGLVDVQIRIAPLADDVRTFRTFWDVVRFNAQ